MRLKQIENFLAIVDCGSVRAAARKLRVSQPTITNSLRALERELQVQLLDRTPRGIIPTALGRTFLTRARAAREELRRAEEELAKAGTAEGGTVAFAVGPVAAVLIMPSAFTAFHRQFPKARVRIVEGLPPATLPLVRDGSLDFATGPRLDGTMDPALVSKPIFREEFVVAARKGHPLRKASKLADLKDAEWLSFWSADLAGDPLRASFASVGLSAPYPAVLCESYNTAVGVLASSDMLAMLSRRMLSGPLARQWLEAIPLADRLQESTVLLFTRADRPLTVLASAMVKAIGNASARIAADERHKQN